MHNCDMGADVLRDYGEALMSIEKITSTRYRCRCELPDCPGNGKPWLSEDSKIPERCRWCRRRTWNPKDKRPIKLITIDGETKKVSEWAESAGLSPILIRWRLRHGWDEKEAVTTPPTGKGKTHAIRKRDRRNLG